MGRASEKKPSAVNPTWVAFFREVKRLADIERGRELSTVKTDNKPDQKTFDKTV
jgi:hypothetical protein